MPYAAAVRRCRYAGVWTERCVFMLLAGEVIAARTMNGLYIVFDIIFLCILMGILL